MKESIAKALTLVIGFTIIYLLPLLIDDKTEQKAVNDSVIGNTRDNRDTLGYLLKWRDGSLALLGGIFVVQFAAAEDVPKSGRLGDIAFAIVLAAVPVLLLITVAWVRWIPLKSFMSGKWYWAIMTPLVGFLYVVAGLFVFPPGLFVSEGAASSAGSFSLSASISPNPVHYGEYATLTALTRHGANCTASVVYSAGRPPRFFAGAAQTAGPNGAASWQWHMESKGSGGTATVTCRYRGQSKTAAAGFTIA